jgi:hypothetical protein
MLRRVIMAHLGRRYPSVALAVLFACALLARPASAQQYISAEPKIKLAEFKVLDGKVATQLRDAGAPNDAAKKDFDAFFKVYYYPSMTSTDPVDLGRLGAKREQLFTRYLNTIKSQEIRDYVNNLTLGPMVAVAKGNFHPAVRYNAVLIVSQLDLQPNAKTLPAATEALLGFLENDQTPTSLQLAALIGLQRHLLIGIDGPLADRTTKAALAVINRDKAPNDVKPRVYGWVRRQAAQVLATQFAKGLTAPAQDALVRLLKDESVDLDDRCESAKLLQPAMYQSAKGVDGNAMTMALGELARKVLTVEAKDAKDYQDKLFASGNVPVGPGGNMSFMPRGEMGPGMGMDMAMLDDTTPHYEKRRMVDRSLAIAAAADAVSAGGSAEVKERAKKLATTIRTSAEALAGEANETRVTDAVLTLGGEVDKLVASWNPGAAAAPAPGANGGEKKAKAAPDAAG